MFKKYVEMIAQAETDEELSQIFNGEGGIDEAYQKGKIGLKDHQILLKLINKMIEWYVYED